MSSTNEQLKHLPACSTLAANSVTISYADAKRQHDYHVEMAQHWRRILGYPPLATGAQQTRARRKAAR